MPVLDYDSLIYGLPSVWDYWYVPPCPTQIDIFLGNYVSMKDKFNNKIISGNALSINSWFVG
jgi:hypothetical protein